MKTVITIVALAVVSTLTLAQEATRFNDNFKSTKSRAEVSTEVTAALARGDQLNWGEAYTSIQPVASSRRVRAEVRAEVLAAVANGEQVHWGEARVWPYVRAHRRAAGLQIGALSN
ncbi:MAG: DUF4148 domain-containing protein [Burkholderiaceae bacterium]|nr:DUF4148 domain-containing protein [Burkholderiaceae bacterium]